MYVCVYVFRVPEVGVGLQPWGLVCPGASNWRQGSRAATGQTTCLSTAAGGSKLYFCICISH